MLLCNAQITTCTLYFLLYIEGEILPVVGTLSRVRSVLAQASGSEYTRVNVSEWVDTENHLLLRGSYEGRPFRDFPFKLVEVLTFPSPNYAIIIFSRGSLHALNYCVLFRAVSCIKNLCSYRDFCALFGTLGDFWYSCAYFTRTTPLGGVGNTKKQCGFGHLAPTSLYRNTESAHTSLDGVVAHRIHSNPEDPE